MNHNYVVPIHNDNCKTILKFVKHYYLTYITLIYTLSIILTLPTTHTHKTKQFFFITIYEHDAQKLYYLYEYMIFSNTHYDNILHDLYNLYVSFFINKMHSHYLSSFKITKTRCICDMSLQDEYRWIALSALKKDRLISKFCNTNSSTNIIKRNFHG